MINIDDIAPFVQIVIGGYFCLTGIRKLRGAALREPASALPRFAKRRLMFFTIVGAIVAAAGLLQLLLTTPHEQRVPAGANESTQSGR